MSDLAAFLLSCIEDDERVAREAATVFVGSPWYKGPFPADQPGHVLTHIARHDPARVLADCEAKRKIVELHDEWVCLHCDMCTCNEADEIDEEGDPQTRHFLCIALRLLAQPYADRPGFDEAWRVE